jgi:hypothetical protein
MLEFLALFGTKITPLTTNRLRGQIEKDAFAKKRDCV